MWVKNQFNLPENEFIIQRKSKTHGGYVDISSISSYKELYRCLRVKNHINLHLVPRNNSESTTELPNASEEIAPSSDSTSKNEESFLPNETYHSDAFMNSPSSSPQPEPSTFNDSTKGAEQDYPHQESNENANTQPSYGPNFNEFLTSFPEDFYEILSSVLAKRDEFISDVGHYLSNTKPFVANLGDHLFKEINRSGIQLNDFVQNELVSLIDFICKDVNDKVVDLQEFREALKSKVAIHITKKLQDGRIGSQKPQETKISMKDVHSAMERSISQLRANNFSSQNINKPAESTSNHQQQSFANSSFEDESSIFTDDIRYCMSCSHRIQVYSFKKYDGYEVCVKCFSNLVYDSINTDSFAQDFRMVKKICRASMNPTPPPLNSQYTMSVCCDFCDKLLDKSLQYKCLDCPNYDICPECFEYRNDIHYGHNFVRIVDRARDTTHYQAAPVIHNSIYCDGINCLTSNQLVVGVRYKCLVCDDYDLCESCEVDPNSGHDQSHPMIKIKVPALHSSIERLANISKATVNITQPSVLETLRKSQTSSAPNFETFDASSSHTNNNSTELGKFPTHLPQSNNRSLLDEIGDNSLYAKPTSKHSDSSPKESLLVDTLDVASELEHDTESNFVEDLLMKNDEETIEDTNELTRVPTITPEDHIVAKIIYANSVSLVTSSLHNSIYAIEVTNDTGSDWPSDTYIQRTEGEKSSSSRFVIAQGQTQTFAIAVSSDVVIDNTSNLKLVVSGYEVDLSLENCDSAAEDNNSSRILESASSGSPNQMQSLSSSEVVLPRLTFSQTSGSNSSTSASALNRTGSTSQAIDAFLTANENSKSASEGSQSDYESVDTGPETPEIISRTVSPSIMAASLSGVDDETDFGDYALDEDDMLTDSEYEFVERDSVSSGN